MVDRRNDFTRRKAEKVRSAVAEVTGIVCATFSKVKISLNKILLLQTSFIIRHKVDNLVISLIQVAGFCSL